MYMEHSYICWRGKGRVSLVLVLVLVWLGCSLVGGVRGAVLVAGFGAEVLADGWRDSCLYVIPPLYDTDLFIDAFCFAAFVVYSVGIECVYIYIERVFVSTPLHLY